MNQLLGTGLIGLIGLFGGGFVLFQAIRGFLITKDISAGNRKINLIQTLIDAKNLDIAKDKEAVKEASDAYEASRSKYDSRTDK